MNAYRLHYPDQPGHRGIDTSTEAAKSISTVTGRFRRMVYHAIGEAGSRGLTSDELAERLGIDRGTVQPRTSELKAQGAIRDSGERRLNRRGKKAIVWVFADRKAVDHG